MERMGQARSARFRDDGVFLFNLKWMLWDREQWEVRACASGWCQGLGYHQEEAYWVAQNPTKTIQRLFQRTYVHCILSHR